MGSAIGTTGPNVARVFDVLLAERDNFTSPATL